METLVIILFALVVRLIAVIGGIIVILRGFKIIVLGIGESSEPNSLEIESGQESKRASLKNIPTGILYSLCGVALVFLAFNAKIEGPVLGLSLIEATRSLGQII